MGEGCAWHIQRQLEEIKRQKARVEAGAVRRTTAEPAKTSAAHPPARLTAASGLVARRLGVPLRGANDGSSRKRSRGVASTAVTKQQVFSDEEGGQSDAPPQADAPGYGYGNGATSNGSDGGGESRKVRHVRSRGHATVVSSRGRNIVGTLLGHLASARQRLAEERRARKAATGAHATDAAGPSTQEPPDAPEGPRRWATERRARARRREAAGRREPSEESNAAEDEEADERLDEQAAVAEETEEEEQEEAQDIDRAIQEKEMLLLQQRLEGHYMHMKNFIRTQVEPTIFYLPAKHTPETERFLEETRVAIEQKIRSLKTHLQCPADAAAAEASADSEADASEEASEEASREVHEARRHRRQRPRAAQATGGPR